MGGKKWSIPTEYKGIQNLLARGKYLEAFYEMEMDDLGEKIKEATTEEEKLPMIKKYLGLSKQINKLRIKE